MNETLKDVSDSLATVVAQAGPGVVRVEARRRVPASGAVWSADGLVVTAHHVVERDENLRIGLPDGNAVPATLIGRDPTTDVAILRAQTDGLTPALWSDGEGLAVGHLTLALGRPGRTVQATLGIVSALGGDWRSPAGGQVDRYLQTDVVMYPGFSGGPLVDVAGRALGITTSDLLRGFSITVPTVTVRRVADTLLAHGRMRRGFLGVTAQAVRLPEALAGELDQPSGLMLLSVEAGGPADQAGLAMGDTIVGLAGAPVRDLDDLLLQLSGDRIAKSVSVRIVRGGQVLERSIIVGERG
jgi:S1-C subfamily serine protease